MVALRTGVVAVVVCRERKDGNPGLMFGKAVKRE